MPELPDVALYVEHLTRRLAGRTLERVRVASPFLLRTVAPPLSAAEGRTIRGFRRLGKRVVFELEGGPFLAVHLMIAGRFHWKDAARAPVPKKVGLAAFDVPGATLLLTEASPKKRAALHVVATEEELVALSRGGVEPLEADLATFARGSPLREPHRQAGADRPASLQRHRERLLRRDPPRGADVPVRADAEARRRRASRGSTTRRGRR